VNKAAVNKAAVNKAAVKTAAMKTATMRWCITFAGVSGAMAVVMAAATGHGSQMGLDGESLSRIETAVRYQIWHALALLAVSALGIRGGTRALKLSAVCFALGSLLFCGGLYLLAFSGTEIFVWLVPIGGLAFAAGWLFLAVHGWRLA